MTSVSEFFRPNLAKRTRSNTVTDFEEEEGLLKVLTFVIDNNISFNALNSESFQDLIQYYNRLVVILRLLIYHNKFY